MKHAILFKNMLGQRKPCSFRNIEQKLKIKSLPLNNDLSKDLFSLYNYNNNEQIRLNIGGDHSISIATLSSSIKKHGNNIKVLWFDAHADINSYEKSETKNVHGMVLNYITQLGNNKPLFNFLPDNKLDPKNILYIGLRDIDPYENKIIEKYNINVISPEDVNTDPKNTTKKINDFIKESKFHLSFDIDGIDPSFMPSTGTPVENGMTMDSVCYILQNINHKNRINCDLVEYNCDIGNKNQQNITYTNVKKLIDILYNK